MSSQHDFKSHLLEILERYMSVGDSDITRSFTMAIPECTPMDQAATFFFSMIRMYAKDNKDLRYKPDSIAISYDGVYQCLRMGIILCE